MTDKKYLKWWQKLTYGSGDFGSNYTITFISSFVMIYLTDTVGLDSGIVATLIMVSKCLDGITDVVFGSMIDKTRSKMGRARPWMFWSTFPLAVSQILLFMIPSMSQQLQYVYFFVVYTLVNAVFYTANNIAYSSLTSLVTKNPNERVQMGSFRFMFAAAAVLTISSATIGLVTSFGGGADGWRAVAFLYTGIMIAFNMIGVLFIREIPIGEGAEKGKKEPLHFWRNMKLLVQNRYCMLVLAYYILYYTSSGITGGVGVYYCIYVLHNAALLGVISLCTMGPAILGLILTPVLVKKFGIYRVNRTGLILSSVFAAVYAFFGYQGNFSMMVVFLALRAVTASPMMGTLNAVIAEASTYTYLKENIRLDGTMFSCSSMGMKVGGGLGTALCGWLLALGGYVGTAEAQTDGAIRMICFMYLILPVVISVLSALVVSFLNVEKANRQLMDAQQ